MYNNQNRPYRHPSSSYDEERARKRRERRTSSSRNKSFFAGMDRIKLVMVIFAAAALVLVGKIFIIQIIKAPELLEEAAKYRVNSIVLHGKRGTIYDRNGNVLAMSAECQTIYCNPKEIKDPSSYATIMAADLGGSANDYMKALTADTTFSYVKKKVDEDKAKKLKSDLYQARLEGVYYLSDTKRVYPYGSCAGQVLGMVGQDGDGLTGLELQYNDILHGKDGTLEIERGRDGTPIAGGVHEEHEAENGTDIVVSLDVNIQQLAEERIAEATGEFDADSGSVMVMEPKTGEVLAVCSTPLANLQKPHTITNEALKVRPISDSYEPGSIFKVLTMAIGIDNQVISPSTTFEVPTTIKVGSDWVKDDDGRPQGMEMSATEILRRSSNVGAVMVGESIGASKFSQGVEKFGIGTKTGIDFPGESQGLVTPLDKYTGATLGSMSFGQGVAVPVDQMVRAIGTIANDGKMVTPHFLVAKGSQTVSWPDAQQVISADTAHKVRDMMRVVVQEGTAKKAQVEHFDIAGKTGTGEQASEDGGYAANKFTSSLIGFANADNPELIVYVGLNGTPYLACSSSAPTFSAIMRESLIDMDVRPVS